MANLLKAVKSLINPPAALKQKTTQDIGAGDRVVLWLGTQNIGYRIVEAEVIKRDHNTLITREWSSRGNAYEFARDIKHFVCFADDAAAISALHNMIGAAA